MSLLSSHHDGNGVHDINGWHGSSLLWWEVGLGGNHTRLVAHTGSGNTSLRGRDGHGRRIRPLGTRARRSRGAHDALRIIALRRRSTRLGGLAVSGRFPRLLAHHAPANLTIVLSEELVAKGTGIHPPGDLTESPSVEFACEAGVLVHTVRHWRTSLFDGGYSRSLLGDGSSRSRAVLGIGRITPLGRKVSRKNTSRKNIGTKDDKRPSVGQP